MKIHENRRAYIRLISFFCAVVVLLGGFTYVGYSTAGRYRTRIENSYRRALEELSTSISNLETTLIKSLYSNSLPEQTLLAAKLLRESSCAKEALSMLPLEEVPLDGVNRFLSQTGEFAVSLSTRLASGEALSDQDYESLRSLHRYARSMSASLQDSEAELLDQKGGSWIFLQKLSGESEALPVVMDGFREMEEGFSDYPSLIYDGPFSDHIQQQTPRMTEGRTDFGVEAARSAAVNFLALGNVSAGTLETLGESGGNMPVYSFSQGTFTLDVTRGGCFVARVIDSRSVDKSVISIEQAIANAKVFLNMQGYADFQESYYSTSGNICTVNFAGVQDGAVCYPDLIKVSVALDNGSVVLFDACGYLMNHTARTLPPAQLSAEQAAEKLSPALTPRGDAKTAVIPTSGGNEACCYEFKCTGTDGETVLVYIDTQTGLERQVLILLQSDGGVLTI